MFATPFHKSFAMSTLRSPNQACGTAFRALLLGSIRETCALGCQGGGQASPRRGLAGQTDLLMPAQMVSPRHLVATPWNGSRNCCSWRWRWLTVWMGWLPRRRCPAGRLTASCWTPRLRAQPGQPVPPSITSTASGASSGFRAACRFAWLAVSSTAPAVSPPRAVATRTGTGSRDRPRRLAGPPRRRGGGPGPASPCGCAGSTSRRPPPARPAVSR